ncbi:MAG: SDR family NAD(P)-dependent oxidoreductase [Pseudomonadota bacterium]
MSSINTHANRVAVVTGAARGIGQAISRQLGERGAKLVLVDLEAATETASKLSASGAESLCVNADVSLPEDWERIAAMTIERFGRADILVNNAGIYPFAEFDKLTYELWSRVLRVNLDSQFLGAKALVPLMQRNGWGRIVNVSSNSIAIAATGLSHYMASKMGAIGLTRGLANDVAPLGVTVNAVCPALTDTPGQRSRPRAELEAVAGLQAIKRIAQADDIVGPILFLTSDDAGFMTGQTLVVDGGMFKL